MPEIGVAISTYRRPQGDTLSRALEAWDRYLPDKAKLVIVDDGSPDPHPLVTHRLPENRGVAAVKNRCLAELDDCQHIFLADDDVWPKLGAWWQRYVRDPEPHLIMCWGQSRLVRKDPPYKVYSHPRGVMQYVEHRVVDRVGGMRTEFGRWGSEHVEWTLRIHNCGFTRYPYQDLGGSGSWFHAEDRKRPNESPEQYRARRNAHNTVPPEVRRGSWEHRRALMERYRDSTDFVPYR